MHCNATPHAAAAVQPRRILPALIILLLPIFFPVTPAHSGSDARALGRILRPASHA